MYEPTMKKFERHARTKKYNSDDNVKTTNNMKNCSTPPPPPPYGDEEGWDLQFCKWWGWNWVRKEQNYVTKRDREFPSDNRPLREQTMKNKQKMRGAGDVPLQQPKHDKNRYFKHIRNLFVKLKHTSSIQKFFNTPSARQCCHCNYGIKEKKNVPFAGYKRCYLEDKGHKHTCNKDPTDDSSGSTSVGLCSSLKQMYFGRRKQAQNDVLVTKTDSFQQTQETRKTKKKRYYHLVCSSCYPQICCCRCHKQADTKEVQVQHCSSPNQSNPKDSLSASKFPYLINKPDDDIKHKQIPELPPGDYRCQQLHHEDSSNKRRPHLLNRWRYQPQTYQVTPLELHRCTQNKEHTRYVGLEGDGHFCYHGSHLGEVFNTQIIPEKENGDRWNVKAKQTTVSPEKSDGFRRRQSALPVLSESSYSDNASENLFYSDRCLDQKKGDWNIGIKDQLQQERQERTLTNPRVRSERENIRSTQEPRRRLRCQSHIQSSKFEDLPNWFTWPPPPHDRKPSNYPRKLSNCNKFVRECQNFQKQLPYKATQPLLETKTVHSKRPSNDIHSFNFPHVPRKKPKMSDTQEKENPYKIYRDWNRITFGKNTLPKFGSYNQIYPQIQNTRSDILDRQYSLKLEEEFFSPVSRKMYNISPRSIVDPKNYASSSLPDPIDVDDDLKYLEKLETAVKIDRSSRIMLDAVCDAILFATDNKHQTAESTLIRKFSYPDADEGICNKCDGSSFQYSPDSPTSQKSELVFMEKLENLVESILNTKLRQNEKNNNDMIDSSNHSPVLSEPIKTYKVTEMTTDSQQSTGHSISEQFNKLNNLFDKMDQVTIQNEANVKKIQEAMQPLSEAKENNLNLKDSANHPFSVSLLDQIVSSFNKEEKQKYSDTMKNVHRLPKNNVKIITSTNKNENGLESTTSGINRFRNFNIQASHSYGNQQETSKFVFKNVSDVYVKSKIPVSRPIPNNYSMPVSRTRKGFRNRDTNKNKKIRTRIPIRKKI